MDDPAADVVAAQVLHRPHAVAAQGGLDRGGDARDGDPGPCGVDGSLEGGARGLDQPLGGRPAAHVHGDCGVDDPAVDVHADVELGEVALGVDGVVLRRRAVVGRDLVARALGRKREVPPAAAYLVLDRFAHRPQGRSRHDQARPHLTRRGRHPARLAQDSEDLVRQAALSRPSS
jgi:hypothetical protein